jgi:hypothetical protein
MLYYIEENKYRVIEHNGSFILQKADPNTILTSSPPQIKWDYVGIVIKNTHEIDRLKAENARLREALEFYAQKPEPDITSIFAKSAEEWGVGSATWEPLLDLGEKAREALKGE